jgi:hypothetical protein
MSGRVGGRSSTYKPATAAIICTQLIDGKSLRAICRQEGMPSVSTVHHWIERYEDFGYRVARARKLQAHTFVDELQEIIAICLDIVNGVRAGTMEQIQAAKVCAENYRWIAGKALPAVYGDLLRHSGPDGEGPIGVKLSLDYSALDPHELVELRRLIAKAELAANQKTALLIEGEAEDDDG